MATQLGICRYCLQEKQLIKSHIIPQAFQKYVKDEKRKMIAINMIHQYSKSVEDGLFDKGILCFECDNSFSSDEKYTLKYLDGFIYDSIDPIKITEDKTSTYFHYDADTTRIKKCLLSILWRMSITTRMEFSKVQLGTVEIKLRNGLYNNRFMAEDFFPVSLVSTKAIKGVESKILYPPIGRFKYHLQSFYPLILPQLMILFYASDSIRFQLDQIGMKENQDLIIGEEKTENTRILLLEHYKTIPDVSKWNKSNR